MADGNCFGKVITDARELAGEILRRGVAALGILGQAALDDPPQRRRNLRIDRPDRLRLLVQDRRERVDRRPLLERPPARRHLVQDRAEARTGPTGNPPTPRSPAPATCSRPCPTIIPGSSPSRWADATPRRCPIPSYVSFARPKSRILTSPSFVTMTFSGFRSRCTIPASCAFEQPLRHLRRDRQELLDRQRATHEQLAQRLALHPLHGDVGDAVLPTRCRRP